MKCDETGALRAYLDGELPASLAEETRRHLEDCARCRAATETLAATASEIGALLKTETADGYASIALARLRQSIETSGWRSDSRRNGWRMFASVRLAAAAAALVAALVLLVAFTPMRLAADDLLAVFRVQRFTAITIDVTQLPVPQLAMQAQPKLAVTPSLPPFVPPQIREASPAEAGAAVDFPVRQPQYLPTGLNNPGRTLVSSGVEYSYTISLATVQSLMAAAGGTNLVPPAGLDGATLRAQVPPVVATLYGALATMPLASTGAPEQGTGGPDTIAQLASGPSLVFVQTRGPALEVPDTIDVELLREEILALPILPPDLARQLRAVKDWRHTLVIPVPPGTHQDVTVAGAPGLLIQQGEQVNTLLWQRNGVLYGLVGNVSASELMRVAGSLGLA